jgi:cytoskeletal protein CcmA (bactofilin family)
MFSKDKNSDAPTPTATLTPEPSRQGTLSATQSIISRDLKIKGDLICNGAIQIDGVVEGDVMHQPLAMEPGAFFEGRCSRIDSSQSGDRVGVAKDRSVAGSEATPATAARAELTSIRSAAVSRHS